MKPADQPIVRTKLPESDVRLTHFTHGLGCACKLRPQVLETILAELPAPKDSRVMVGTGTADDAGVFRLDEKTALVQTVDFFTPVVDDPYHFGAIAAANSLSDIYAMGGKPLFALNVVGFPSNRLPVSVLKRILQGASEKAEEAGVSIIGGHTVDDTEPKFGLAVTGIVHPDQVLTNARAQPDDTLILTKPLGTGIVSTAAKRGHADKDVIDYSIRLMSTLNDRAAEIMMKFSVKSCTDVTGFGLMGHLLEMCRASGVDAVVHSKSVPLIVEAKEFATAGIIPGGTLSNHDYTTAVVNWADDVPRSVQMLLCDAQTSGGLLIPITSDRADDMLEELKNNGVTEAAIIGRFTSAGSGAISVL
jgi:selenium donor protein